MKKEKGVEWGIEEEGEEGREGRKEKRMRKGKKKEGIATKDTPRL